MRRALVIAIAGLGLGLGFVGRADAAWEQARWDVAWPAPGTTRTTSFNLPPRSYYVRAELDFARLSPYTWRPLACGAIGFRAYLATFRVVDRYGPDGPTSVDLTLRSGRLCLLHPYWSQVLVTYWR